MNKEERKLRDKKIIRLFSDGLFSISEIADKLNLSGECVRIILHKNKVDFHKIRINTLRINFSEFINKHSYLPAFNDVCALESKQQRQEFKRLKKEALRRGVIAKRTTPESTLLSELLKTAKKLKRTPGMSAINESKFKYQTYIHRFGSITKAQKLAGLNPNHRGARKGTNNHTS